MKKKNLNKSFAKCQPHADENSSSLNKNFQQTKIRERFFFRDRDTNHDSIYIIYEYINLYKKQNDYNCSNNFYPISGSNLYTVA